MSKTLERVALLLNQAENAGTPEEAEAFAERAQEIASRSGFDLEVARRHQADKTKREVPIQRRITVAGYVGGGYNPNAVYGNTRKRVQNNAAEMVRLFLDIADVNDVKCNIAHNSTYVVAFGFPSDIDVCELLWASLATQMKSLADAAVKRGDQKSETVERWDRKQRCYVEKPVNGRIYRTSFYQGFTRRIKQRLLAAKSEALAAVKDDHFMVTDTDVAGVVEEVAKTGEIVLMEKAVEVSDFYKATSDARGSWRGGSRSTATSHSGRRAGDAAGSAARLGATPVIANRPSISA